MTKETMTIHSALASLKVLDSRIINAIDKNSYVTQVKNNVQQISGVPLAEKKEQMKAGFESVTDLIRRRAALKKAIVLSNAKTIVTIGGVEYTVAEAIEMKNHGIEFDTILLAELQRQYMSAQATIMKHNESLDKKADDYVTGMLGNKEGRTNVDEFDKARKTYIEANTAVLVDPIDVHKQIELLTQKIDNFTAEVDSALSVSNALTIIEIEY